MRTAAAVAIIAASVAVHVALGLGPIRSFSATYDEPVHLTAGVVYWKTGRMDFNGYHHPPFGEAWAAIPAARMNPIVPTQDPAWIRGEWGPLDQYRFADAFFHRNRVPFDRMLSAARRMQLALSAVLGVLIAAAAWRLGGAFAGAVAASLWAASPTLLAHGTLVSTDLPFALAFFSFFIALMGRSWRWAAAAGAALGLCASSKYFFPVAGPALAGLAAWEWMRGEDAGIGLKRGNFALRWLAIGGAAAVVVVAVFRVSGLDIFIDGVRGIFTRAQAGRSSFMAGEHGTTGWLLYFPFVFLVKTPLPELLAVLGVKALAFTRRVRIPPALWIPPLALLLVACFSKVQIGHRHILAVYPFLFVAAGLAAASLGRFRWAAFALAGWTFVDAWMVRPHFLAYFNPAAGGPRNGHKLLTDSNIDWGQGLRELGGSLTDDERRRGIFLSYFGTAEPHAYGIRYLDVGSDAIAGHRDDTADPSLNPTTLAISVTNLRSTYFADREAFAWLDAYEPARVVGHSIFVYDFSGKPEAVERLHALRRPAAS